MNGLCEQEKKKYTWSSALKLLNWSILLGYYGREKPQGNRGGFHERF